MKSYKFIVNPVAGNGRAKAILPSIERYFKQAGVEFDIYWTRDRGDAIEAANRAAKEGFEVVVATGGDGTVNEVLNGIVGTQACLAVVQGGKGNDFARAVNMPKDVEKACRCLLRAEIQAIDLGRVMDRYFINSVGVGFDAAVALKVNEGTRLFGGVSDYVYAFLKMLNSYRTVEMELDLGNGPLKASPLLVAVGIGQSYGGGMKIVPDAILDDGLFDVCVFEDMKRLQMIYYFPRVFSGKLKDIKQAGMFRTRELKLSLSKPLPLHMEGEIMFGDRMHFTLQPLGMRVLIGTGA